ncbi:MAG: CHAD domain-containing protein [Cystobacter sp.]
MSPSTPQQPHRKSRRRKAARQLITARLADARQAEDALARKFTPDNVHDLRVATRRLRAALKTFRDLGDLAPRERAVKRLQDALGEVRDLHVQGEWLDTKARQGSTVRKTGVQSMHTRLSEALPRRERRLRRALQHWVDQDVPDIERAARRLEGPGKYGGRRARHGLRHRLRQVERLMNDCRENLDAPTAHELRKAVKKLRYEAELFLPALEDGVKPLLKALKPLQETLGELHDADVRLEWLQDFALRGPAARRAAARRLLKDVREERARHAGHASREFEDWREKKRGRDLRARLD